jgi:rare lipoprotein A (peptidoglycan hydrolase)
MLLPPNNRRRGLLRLLVAMLSLGLPLILSAQMMNPTKPPDAKKRAKIEGDAVWYQVPPNSLAKRRAGRDELTAAHNRLPLGTRVRVTHLKNGKSVVVRITDRGITKRRAVIDLCKEAAEKLDMIHEGSARVTLEILPDDKAPPSKAKSPSW